MKIDPSPFLDEEYEIFVAQNVERLPAEKLLRETRERGRK